MIDHQLDPITGADERLTDVRSDQARRSGLLMLVDLDIDGIHSHRSESVVQEETREGEEVERRLLRGKLTIEGLADLDLAPLREVETSVQIQPLATSAL